MKKETERIEKNEKMSIDVIIKIKKKMLKVKDRKDSGSQGKCKTIDSKEDCKLRHSNKNKVSEFRKPWMSKKEEKCVKESKVERKS